MSLFAPQTHQTRVGSLSGQAWGPVSDRLSGQWEEVPFRLARFPVSFRLSAFASRVFLHPLESWAFLAVGLPGVLSPGLQRDFHVPHMQDTTGLGALFTPEQWCSPDRNRISGRHSPHSSGLPCTALTASHPRTLIVTRHQQGFTFVHPLGLPQPVTPGWNRGSWAASPGFVPRDYSRRTPGRGQVLSTDLRRRY